MAIAQPGQASERSVSHDARILVVDDEADIANLLGTVLREEGFTVRVVTDSRQAIDVFNAFHPDLVSLDIMMPSVDGKPGRVFTRDDLLSGVWGYEPGSDTRLVDVHVGRLRKKLLDGGVTEVQIETARGFGYKLTATQQGQQAQAS